MVNDLNQVPQKNSIDQKHAIDQLSHQVFFLKKSIEEISNKSKGLQIWLIIWTALMSIATIFSLFLKQI